MLKKVLLIFHGLIYILIEFMVYALNEIPSVPHQYNDMYKNFTLYAFLITLVAQGSILLFNKRRFLTTIILQFSAFLAVVLLDMIMNQYMDNQVTSYPEWSDFHWLVPLEVCVILLIGWLVKGQEGIKK